MSVSVSMTLGAAFAACALAASPVSNLRFVQTLAGQGKRGAQFGASVALSGDGTTALIGAPQTDVQNGAAFVYVRSGSTWKQQGATITGSTLDYLGASVALSASGDTALVDEPVGVGHVWVYTRSGSAWKRQAELVGRGVQDDSGFGDGLALSGDGNTALVGDPDDHRDVGAVWIFTRSGSRWTQGPHFTGQGVKNGSFGEPVALSGDGTTALVGWSGYRNFDGAAQVYTRSGSTWKAGALLSDHGETEDDAFGSQVALSGDGDTAVVVGQDSDDSWAFARSGVKWAQVELPKVAANVVFNSLVLTADGTTALVGAQSVNGGAGRVYSYMRSGARWTLDRATLSVGGGDGGAFGNSLAVSANGDVVLVGGADADHETGAAWLFAAPG